MIIVKLAYLMVYINLRTALFSNLINTLTQSFLSLAAV